MSQQVRPSLRLAVERQVLWTVLHVSGELGWESHDTFNNCLSELVSGPDQPRICIDLSRLEFCDSSGVGSMLRAWRAATRKGGALILLRPDASMARRLVVMGLDGTLPVVDDLPG